jgi:hypothetical protein
VALSTIVLGVVEIQKWFDGGSAMTSGVYHPTA